MGTTISDLVSTEQTRYRGSEGTSSTITLSLLCHSGSADSREYTHTRLALFETIRSQGSISATCLGCFLSRLPQTRHPERSASQINRVTRRLWRGVEGPRRCLFYPCCSELFDHRSSLLTLIRTINPEFIDLAQSWERRHPWRSSRIIIDLRSEPDILRTAVHMTR
jgi:hypothetical protein